MFTLVLKTKKDIKGDIHIFIDYMKEDIYEFHNQRRHLKYLQNDTYIYVPAVQFEEETKKNSIGVLHIQ